MMLIHDSATEIFFQFLAKIILELKVEHYLVVVL